MKRAFLVLTFACYATCFSQAQSLFASITSTGKKSQVIVVPHGDSVLVRYDEKASSQTEKRTNTYWLKANGEKRRMQLDHDVFRVIRDSLQTYYYFYEQDAMKVMVSGNNTGRITSTLRVPLSGQLFAHFEDNDKLVAVFLSRDGSTMDVCHVSGATVTNNIKYTLPTPVSPHIHKNDYIEIYDGGSPINSFKGHNKVKFFKYEQDFYLVIDHERNPPTAKAPHNTIVFKLAADGKVTETSFVQPLDLEFTSYVLGLNNFGNSRQLQSMSHAFNGRRFLRAFSFDHQSKGLGPI